MTPDHREPNPKTGVRAECKKYHSWNPCPCGSGLRFGQCCGRAGDKCCRYEADRTRETPGKP